MNGFAIMTIVFLLDGADATGSSSPKLLLETPPPMYIPVEDTPVSNFQSSMKEPKEAREEEESDASIFTPSSTTKSKEKAAEKPTTDDDDEAYTDDDEAYTGKEVYTVPKIHETERIFNGLSLEDRAKFLDENREFLNEDLDFVKEIKDNLEKLTGENGWPDDTKRILASLSEKDVVALLKENPVLAQKLKDHYANDKESFWYKIAISSLDYETDRILSARGLHSAEFLNENLEFLNEDLDSVKTLKKGYAKKSTGANSWPKDTERFLASLSKEEVVALLKENPVLAKKLKKYYTGSEKPDWYQKAIESPDYQATARIVEDLPGLFTGKEFFDENREFLNVNQDSLKKLKKKYASKWTGENSWPKKTERLLARLSEKEEKDVVALLNENPVLAKKFKEYYTTRDMPDWYKKAIDSPEYGKEGTSSKRVMYDFDYDYDEAQQEAYLDRRFY